MRSAFEELIGWAVIQLKEAVKQLERGTKDRMRNWYRGKRMLVKMLLEQRSRPVACLGAGVHRNGTRLGVEVGRENPSISLAQHRPLCYRHSLYYYSLEHISSLDHLPHALDHQSESCASITFNNQQLPNVTPSLNTRTNLQVSTLSILHSPSFPIQDRGAQCPLPYRAEPAIPTALATAEARRRRRMRWR